MPSERIQRQIDRLLDEIEAAAASLDWSRVRELADGVLRLDPENEDAKAFLDAANRDTGVTPSPMLAPEVERSQAPPLPASFAGGRYAVKSFLGEGGRKRVYLAHDTRLDRDVALSLIKTEGLDLLGLQRVRSEAQAMARLGDHPNIVTVFDVGDEGSQPYIVSQYMAGGSVEDLLAAAEDHRLPLGHTLRIAEQVCAALEHAHKQGIVHRDLKPGNVWLSALTLTLSPGERVRVRGSPEGVGPLASNPGGTLVAKLGDFGLAVALDRSRVTMAGMMLGTVAYMPPEQALGGESTPKADLYSLGCMLYEMVTGRPPFLGEDPTAVISQHINTPPVAPSWLSDRCPPALEEVILHLLAKAPDARPASAAEVAPALAKVDPAQKSASHSDSSENPLDRLARGVFVGRTAELEKLRKAFDEAFAGHGGLVMLVGEPGIGKTRTTQEIETYARMRGATVLWGRTHETGGAPAYWPWYQAGNQFAAAYDLTTVIAPNLPPGAGAELSRIFTWLRQQPNFVEPEPITDPEVAQFRLFDAYAAFIRAMAIQTPLVIALDDLHWADKPSLLLLQHIARDLSRLRVLIVGNYRDTDITRQSALSETLAVLNRESGFERIVLRGLSRAEVAGYIRATANVEPKREVLDRIFEETEGNAFFLSEVVNLMAQEGTLTRESVSDIRIPDGVREALGRRLNRLSEETNDLLQVAAIIGREFTYDMLTLLGDRDEDALLKLIEEALAARVIEETVGQAGRYRFTHAQMQETLLDELSTTRRVRLQGRVGEALEKRWGEQLALARAPRLAGHFVEAAMLSPRHAQKAVAYSKAAAEQAEGQTAWGEAARHYENCLTLVTGSDGALGESEADLLLALGRCQSFAGTFRPAWRSLMRATTLYRQLGDWGGSARATVIAFGVAAPPARHLEIITAALDASGQSDPHLEANLYARRASIPGNDQAEQDIERAAALSEAHGLADVQAGLTLIAAGRARDLAEALPLYRLAARDLQEVGEKKGASAALRYVAGYSWYSGSLDEAVAAFEALLSYARSVHDAFEVANALGFLGAIALLRCDLNRAQDLAAEVGGGSYLRENLLASLAELRGDLEGIKALLPSGEMTGGIPVMQVQVHGARARILLESGDREGARLELETWARAVGNLEQAGGGALRGHLEAIGPALAHLGDDETIRRTYEFTAAAPELHFGYFGSLDQFRGALALRLGKLDEAERWFRSGGEVCERERCPVEAGRNLVGLAEVAERRGQAREALQHLDRAMALFQQHGAKLYLDQAIAMKVRLQGVTSGNAGSSIDRVAESARAERPALPDWASAPEGTVTILFSDIEDSTVLTEKLGDRAWMALLQKHNALIRQQVRAHGGFEVKTIGDGFMVAFQSARRALECAIQIQKAFAAPEAPVLRQAQDGQAEALSVHPEALEGWGGLGFALRVRIGLHAGEAIKDKDDFYGKNVILASRIGGIATGGQILVSSLLKDLTESSGDFRFGDGREVELKGLSGRQRVFVVAWE